jgi:hypothetical protein
MVVDDFDCFRLRPPRVQRRKSYRNNAIPYHVTVPRHYQAFGLILEASRPPIGREGGLVPQFCAFPPPACGVAFAGLIPDADYSMIIL